PRSPGVAPGDQQRVSPARAVSPEAAFSVGRLPSPNLNPGQRSVQSGCIGACLVSVRQLPEREGSIGSEQQETKHMNRFAIALGALGLTTALGLTEASAGSRVVIDQHGNGHAASAVQNGNG